MLTRADIDEAISSQDLAQLRDAFREIVKSDDEREIDIDDAEEFGDTFERLRQALALDMAEMPADTVRDLNARLDEGGRLRPGALFF